MGPRTPVVLALWALAWAAGLCHAQPVSYLRVEQVASFEPRFSLIELDAERGEVDASARLERAPWLYGLGDWGSHNYSAVGGDGVELQPSELIEASEVVVFGVDLGERVVEMETEQFALLAARAGVEWAPEPRQDRVFVRWIEGSKALVRGVGQAEVVSGQAATAKRGERAEIRPLFDPTALVAPSAFAVRVYFDGGSAAGCDVLATHVATGAEQRVTADEHGIATLELHEAGAWRVEYHRVTPAGERDQEASWVVYSATLSFEMAGGVR